MWLTVVTFPWPVMALWQRSSPFECSSSTHGYTLVSSASYAHMPITCELALPILWNLLNPPPTLSHVRTFAGPGPFTALRAGQAFAQAVCFGDPLCTYTSVSWFDLVPQEYREHYAIDTGGGLWLDHRGQRVSMPSHTHWRLSAQHGTSIPDVVEWSQHLIHHSVPSNVS